MISPTPCLPESDTNLYMEIIRQFLKQQGLVNLTQLLSQHPGHTASLSTILTTLISEGCIECLRPASLSPATADSPSPREADMIYYRWIQPTDLDYVWQKHIIRPHHERQKHAHHHPLFEPSSSRLRRFLIRP